MAQLTPIVQRRPPAGAKKRRRGAAVYEHKGSHPGWFLIPAFVFIALFYLIPALYNFVLPFTNWSAYSSTLEYKGVDAFTRVVEDGTLFTDLRITLVYALMVAFFQNAFGLGLALLLEKNTRLNRGLRALFFIPVLMSALAVGYMFQAILKPDGVLNQILGFFAGAEVSIAWLGNIDWSIVVVAMVQGWKWMGLAMLIYLAGLISINPDLLEAARIDGATGFKLFRHIKVPLLAPAFTFNIATSLLGAMNGFEVVKATTDGGPGRTTEVLNIYIFNTFGQGLFNQASAMSLVLFLVVLALAFPLIAFLRSRERAMD
ncbi:sugar ABC transporter permease [Microbacterium marmarense]|uniref:Sugar ABC transporter permease n=1 Tax=Microbacterium marmarense TaxID=3122051 RepID=A0ABU8LQW3_9MICO